MSETTTPVKIIKTSAAADLDTIRNVASGSLNPRTAFALSKVRAFSVGSLAEPYHSPEKLLSEPFDCQSF